MRNAALRGTALLLCITLALAAGMEPCEATEGTAASTRLTLYFVLSTENEFYLVPVGVEVPHTDRPAERAIEMLISGAPAGSLVTSLIPRDTRLLGYRMEGGTAIVDFSNEITRANVGSSGEAMIIGSIATTLGQFPEVEMVELLVEGKPFETLAGHVDISGPIPVRDSWGRSRFRGFEDASGHWAEGQITALYAGGVISGYPDGLFRPGGAVSRAEFVKMLISSLEDTPGGGTGGHQGTVPGDVGFQDVPDTAWYKTYLDRAVSAGVVLVDDYGGTFGADTPVTRREVAVMLVRATGLEAEAVEKRGAALPFTDVADQPDWAKGYLAAALEHGLVAGDPDGTFRPYGRLTRAEAATVIARVMGLGGPNVFVLRPATGESVSNVAVVAGVARVFEASVCARIKQDGDVISQVCTTASEGAPGWGFFAVLLDVPEGDGNELEVEALTFSAKDGSEQDVVSRHVTRVP